MIPFRRCAELATALACLSAALPAIAHVTLEVPEAAAGSYYKAVFRVSHGCEGSPTVALRVEIPEGVASAKPQPKPGWQVATSKRKLAQPVDLGHGRSATEVVREVAWTGGPLLNDQYDEFVVQLRLPATPGQTLYFPVVQGCERGEHRWTETEQAGSGGHAHHRGEGHPAPRLRLTGGAR
jgi:uncharacterized protein YcnI